MGLVIEGIYLITIDMVRKNLFITIIVCVHNFLVQEIRRCLPKSDKQQRLMQGL